MTTADGRIPRLAEIDLPDFGAAVARPDLPAERYPERLARLRERMERCG